MNIASFMERAGKAYADSPAVAVGRTPWLTYGELARRVAALAGGLRQLHAIGPGARIAIFSHNCPEYLETLYAIWHAGAIAVPINAKLHAKEAAYILQHSGTSLCFVAPKSIADLAPVAGEATLVAIGSEDYRALLATPAVAMAEAERDAPAWIFYTSGTTGRPKGATLSHANLLAMSLCYFADVDSVGPWPAVLHAAPMSHGSGLYALPYVMQAGCHVIPESGGFDVDEVYGLIAAWPGLAFFADDGQAAGRRPYTARYDQSQGDRLWRRPDVSGRLPCRAGALRRQDDPALRSGRNPDDDHRAQRAPA